MDPTKYHKKKIQIKKEGAKDDSDRSIRDVGRRDL